ncbi:diaminopimelate epimerase [Rhizobium sp. CCGE 510]|uniref:diaminopimelate epimerase n=1 Tax=Rhizobium sp. CCGE 510 TaxID=1132836 RepID=UPI00027B92A3|nr:diaminopimelate epimerase [Rhizobium sp. CCGE 510]EJT05436.1 diaminopimelate epimerase [Rhizobium sp. CCGE 510]
MSFSFQKMHANGDDFVVVDLRGQANKINRDIAKRLGDRNRGIGFNQLAVMSDCDDAAVRLTFWNPDGSMLDACGSATRGVAWQLLRETGSSSVMVRTNRGLLNCSLETDGLISVDMGEPLLHWHDVPIAQEVDTLTLPLPGNPTACSMGNPHCTFFVEDLEAVDVETLGPEMESHPLFPQKTNVHFVQVLSPTRIRLRIWERGGGIPLGSGSCSCGAAVNGIRRGLLGDSVDVECDGGTVTVRWDGIGSVFLTGPVEPNFSGVWFEGPSPNS